MTYKRVYIFLEGDDDERFFNKIIKPRLSPQYDFIGIVRYANLKKEKVTNFLKSIQAMNDADYIFVADLNQSPCVTDRKQKISNRLKKLGQENIIVVISEIEGWYLAGLDQDGAKRIKVSVIDNTEAITKEKFDSLIPKRFDSRIDFMLEILKYYSPEVAQQKNRSLDYFAKKYL